MPMLAAALASMIKVKLKAIPIAKAPEKTNVVTTPNADGTLGVTTTPGVAENVYMDDGTIDAIATAVSSSVVTFLQTNAVVIGTVTGGVNVTAKIT
jgi:hypothetical protein